MCGVSSLSITTLPSDRSTIVASRSPSTSAAPGPRAGGVGPGEAAVPAPAEGQGEAADGIVRLAGDDAHRDERIEAGGGVDAARLHLLGARRIGEGAPEAGALLAALPVDAAVLGPRSRRQRRLRGGVGGREPGAAVVVDAPGVAVRQGELELEARGSEGAPPGRRERRGDGRGQRRRGRGGGGRRRHGRRRTRGARGQREQEQGSERPRAHGGGETYSSSGRPSGRSRSGGRRHVAGRGWRKPLGRILPRIGKRAIPAPS
jgi:hypothetical protein